MVGTSYDPTVPAQAAERYLDLARAAGSERLVRTRRVDGQGHCAFDAAQVGAAFDELVQWVEAGNKAGTEAPTATSAVPPAAAASGSSG